MSVPLLQANAKLLAHLQSIAKISGQEAEALLSIPMDVRDLPANQDIVREGDRPSRSCVLLEGFAATSKVTGSGERQISAHHIPGDVPDLQSLHLEVMDSSLTTLTACRVGFVDHEDLRALCRRHPGLTEALWHMTLIEASIFREWIANVGRRPALARVAHLCAETFFRMKAVGLADADHCAMPLSQVRLAEATGLSVVHVNRTIQTLRQREILDLSRGSLKILNWKLFEEVADFDPSYLHLRRLEARETLIAGERSDG